MTNQTIWVEGNEIDLSILFTPGEKQLKSNLPGLGMHGILLSTAESGVFGSEADVRKIDRDKILLQMYNITKRHEDEELAYKNANK